MNEKKAKMFDAIKQRLTNCENDICFFNDLRVDCTDDNKYICKSAQVKDDELIVTLAMPNGNDMELWKDELDIIAFPNTIFNAITWPDPNQELIDDIDHKLSFQPQMPYVFPVTFDVKLKDGNKFQCTKVEYLDEDCDTISVTVYSDYTGEIELPLDEFFPTESLQEISDNIMPPKTIWVEAQNEKAGITLYRKDVKYNTTEEEMLDIIQKVFPTFRWKHDDDFQFVYYPKGDGDITDEILATLSD